MWRRPQSFSRRLLKLGLLRRWSSFHRSDATGPSTRKTGPSTVLVPVTQAIVATAWDADILDGNPDDTPITDRNEKSITAYEYDVGVLQPVKVIRDGSRTDFEYDYRQRAVTTTVYPYVNKTLTTKVDFDKNRKFSDEDPYGRKTFYGYRASDGAMVRVVKGAYPSFSLSNNSSVLSIGRDTNLNPTHTVKDMIQDLSGNQIQVVDERWNAPLEQVHHYESLLTNLFSGDSGCRRNVSVTHRSRLFGSFVTRMRC